MPPPPPLLLRATGAVRRSGAGGLRARGGASTTTVYPSPARAPAVLAQNLSSTAARRADAHESPYDPPSGWLFGVPPGERAKKEGWEGVWAWGFCGSLGLAAVAYVFKPDTAYVLGLQIYP